MPKSILSIILPTYNERENITLLIKEIIKTTSKIVKQFEIIVVDDNSPDNTAGEIRSKFKNAPYVRLFVRKKNKGLATAVKTGIVKAQGKYILVMDTDFNHDPKEIPKFLKLRHHCELIIGSRYVKNGGMEDKVRQHLSHLFNIFIRILLRHQVHDSLSGFFLIRRTDILKFNLDKIFFGFGEYFIRLIYYAYKAGISIAEIPVFYQKRPKGKSKSKFLHMFVSYTLTALKLKYEKNPS